MITNHRSRGPDPAALTLQEGDLRPEARDEEAPERPRGWNPFVEWKPDRRAPATRLPVNKGLRHPTSQAVSPYEEAEQRRITLAWNGLQLPL